MRAIRLQNAMRSVALFSFVLLTGSAGAAWAGENGGVRAKIEYCQICHGQSGQGFYGYYTIPRLAGQQPDYLEAQLRDYAAGRRVNSVMANVARGVPPGMIGAIATHFHSLNSAAARRRLRRKHRSWQADFRNRPA